MELCVCCLLFFEAILLVEILSVQVHKWDARKSGTLEHNAIRRKAYFLRLHVSLVILANYINYLF